MPTTKFDPLILEFVKSLPIDAQQEFERIALNYISPPTEFFSISPRKTLSVSLTGPKCSLNCSHCGGKYLQQMFSLESLNKIRLDDFKSILITGGSDLTGKVPIATHLQEILALPSKFKLNVHVGLQNSTLLKQLTIKQPVISFELVGDQTTICETFGLNASFEDYQAAYLDLKCYFTVVPHLTIGLRRGCVSGEQKVIEFLKSSILPFLTILIFRPTPKSKWENLSPPRLGEVLQIVEFAKKNLSCPIVLGCMRPGGSYRRAVDFLLWWIGVSRIVQPHPEFIKLIEKIGISIKNFDECCAFMSKEHEIES